VASQDTDALSEDQQTSAQYYRPYNNVNRRPAYPVRRPTYSNYINNQQRPVQRPVQRPQTTSVSSNYRPSAPTVAAQPSNIRPSTSNTGTGTSCTSSNIYRQYGICWDAQIQRLQISSNLTIENLVRFHAYNLYSTPDYPPTQVYSPAFWQQLCEQSRRFNRVGLMCTSESRENYCNVIGDHWTSTALLCVSDDCICVVGEPYETIAKQVASQIPRQISLNNPFNAPVFQSDYWQSWTAGLNQDIQNTLAAHGIYWRP
jgi:hypothetical protein